ncbi:hypothetical protein ABT096_41055 [Streptomyces sp. NPDC002561]|uniref:hypothetical protein n=1 Tax=Streptomyces sp. NPDC002561 TaxID=3154418 RepID=UPI0033262D3C
MGILIRLMCPSITPEFQGRVSPAMTAFVNRLTFNGTITETGTMAGPLPRFCG